MGRQTGCTYSWWGNRLFFAMVVTVARQGQAETSFHPKSVLIKPRSSREGDSPMRRLIVALAFAELCSLRALCPCPECSHADAEPRARSYRRR